MCKKCGNMRHNKRTCKGRRVTERAIPKVVNKKLKEMERKLEKGMDDVGHTIIEEGSQSLQSTKD